MRGSQEPGGAAYVAVTGARTDEVPWSVGPRGTTLRSVGRQQLRVRLSLLATADVGVGWNDGRSPQAMGIVSKALCVARFVFLRRERRG